MYSHFRRVVLFFCILPCKPIPGETLKERGWRGGSRSCKCLDNLPVLSNITRNTVSNQHSRLALKGKARDPVDDCLVATYLDHLQKPDESYCYPIDYGRGKCETWDRHLVPECAKWLGDGDATHHAGEAIAEKCKGRMTNFEKEECVAKFRTKSDSLPWCLEMWCYVDASKCDKAISPSYYFPDRGLHYSYATCGANNYFELWGAPLIDMCEGFDVVEKPYPIMWLSCWASAVMQQIIDLTRYFDEDQSRLSRGQRLYMTFQLCVLISETLANIRRVPWSYTHFWSSYNVYVYVFIHSSVFVRATMMSQVVWDWYDAKLLKDPTIGFDGKGWHDEHRAILLVIIFQFSSSLFVFGLIFVSHLLPALLIYHWIFLLVAAGLVKSRGWVATLGLDPAESRLGRAIVMGTNSFLSCMGIQVLVTSMVRVYAGEWSAGYMTPLTNDYASRRFDVWYACHLGRAGWTMKLFKDQDFINLFLR